MCSCLFDHYILARGALPIRLLPACHLIGVFPGYCDFAFEALSATTVHVTTQPDRSDVGYGHPY